MWTQDQSVAFESAQESITEWMAILMAELDVQEAAGSSPDRVAVLHAELASLALERKALNAFDKDAVALARSRYGDLVRHHREKPAAGV